MFTKPVSFAVLSTIVVMTLLAVVGTALAASGTFRDDDSNIHESNIEAIAAEGITRGCNPPTNDLYCPNGSVTRGQMAAFMRRAFSLPSSSTDYFVDDNGSVFEGDINAVAEAGITKGCNPPDNDRFCPDGKVTRGQMAAFLKRMFDYPLSNTDYFTDDDGSIFEGDINSIAEAGVTKGCNPPTNDLYCPSGLVKRDQMASFLSRALGLDPVEPTVPILARGSGTGDDVVSMNLPNVPVIVEFSHNGSSNFAVISRDRSLGWIDLLVNEIGNYTGTRPMQFAANEPVAALEITADGAWTYKIWRLSDEPMQSCRVDGRGESVIRLTDFKNTSGTATLTHNGSSNFAIWAWAGTSRDLLVNEIGAYSGTVVVPSGSTAWDITADGDWSIDC